MNVTDTYSPRQGSLAYRLIEFLQANPDEELTRADIACKFDATPASIDPSLVTAIEQKILVHKDDDDSLPRRWAAGPRLKSAVLSASVGATSPTKTKRQPTFKLSGMPQPGDLVIDKAIPIPAVGRVSDTYIAVFERLDIGDSFAVPNDCAKRIYEWARKWAKQVGREVTMRRALTTGGDARVWRTK